MSSPNVHTKLSDRRPVADRVATRIADVLRDDQAFSAGSAALPATIVGEMAAAIADLPPETWRELGSRRVELGQRMRQLMESFGAEGHGRIAIRIPDIVEPSKGEGLGSLLSSEKGEAALADIAVARKIEDWAGPVAGATELARDYAIPRSTLNRWQHAGDVIALLKGTKKHVYPIEQFIDGRPARGLAAIGQHADNQRIAWLWLSRPNPVLGGRKPIDLLKQDCVDSVLDAAKAAFSAR